MSSFTCIADLQVVFTEAYPQGNTDFSAILRRLGVLNPDVLAAATYFEDAVAITRQVKDLGVNPRMYGVTVGGDLPKFYETLGRTAEFIYGATPWAPELVTLRAGGLIPIARQYPGAREFVDSYGRKFRGADLSYHSAAGYAMCQILVEATKRAGALDGAKIRDAILKLDLNTVFGAFKVDQRAHGGPRCGGVRASSIRPQTTAPRCRRPRCDARVAQVLELATQR